MKKLSFTFKYSLPPGLRNIDIPQNIALRKYPLIPIRFYTQNKKTRIIEALMDSGLDMIPINKEISEYLNLPQGKRIESTGMGGTYNSYETKVGLILDRGGRDVDFGYISVIYPEQDKDVPILIGRKPVFEEFQVIFEEFNQQFKLIPKEVVLKKRK